MKKYPNNKPKNETKPPPPGQPENRICNACGTRGHIAKNCRKKRN